MTQNNWPLFCGCSDDSVFDLINNISEHINKPDLPKGVKDMLSLLEIDDNGYYSLKAFDTLGDEGKKLVEWCVDYLIYVNEYDDDCYDDGGMFIGEFVDVFEKLILKTNHEQLKQAGNPHFTKYICIASFIYDFLGIKLNSGYDYWLMGILDLYGIMDHGSGIRGGWMNSSDNNIYSDRELSDERKNIIENWIINAPDDI